MDGSHGVPQGAAHARLGASSAHRWLACPGSVALAAQMPETESVYAAEGTLAHAVAERALTHPHRTVADAVTQVMAGGTLAGGLECPDPTELATYVGVYVEAVRLHPGLPFTEMRVDFSHVVPGGFGTADRVTVDIDRGHLVVSDLKYGRGVRVDAAGNPQLRLYAEGAATELEALGVDIQTITTEIHQPRLDHISTEDLTRADLTAWCETVVRPAALAAREPSAPFVPGDAQCRFCPAAAHCRARADWVQALAVDGFGVVQDPQRVSDGELAALLERIAALRAWANAIEERAFAVLQAGGDLPGWKLVEGRANRTWRDPDAAERALARAGLKKDQRTQARLISPAQAEKILGRGHDLLAKHVDRPPGKPTLAPITDPRPALTPATAGFGATTATHGD